MENKVSINNIEQFLKFERFTKTTNLYLRWFDTKGKKLFDYVFMHVDIVSDNDKIRSFYEYYLFLCEEAVAQKNEDLLLDHLYHIPEVMKAEYIRFRFIKPRKT
jgi:hypothetical protein